LSAELIGLIPAGGEARRLAPLPCSKEILPIGYEEDRPKAACRYLLDSMQAAGVTKTYIVLRSGKWDIPGYLGSGAESGMNIAYLMLGPPFGVPYTLDQAYSFVNQASVAFGFPDIICRPEGVFVRLMAWHRAAGAEISLGLFPADQPQCVDMVDWKADGTVSDIVARPARTELRHTWAIAIWNPRFTEFMHAYVAGHHRPDGSELTLGDVIRSAISNGIRVSAVPVSPIPCLDIGTPENLARAFATFLTGSSENRGPQCWQK
jgi:glucose-1-phosphate thymidylyltransferase